MSNLNIDWFYEALNDVESTVDVYFHLSDFLDEKEGGEEQMKFSSNPKE